MIEVTERPGGVLEVDLTGTITGNDYDTVLTPAIDAALTKHQKVRMLAVFGRDFKGYSLEAAWDDAKLGLRYWSGFERAAVVSDVEWIRTMTRAMGLLFPCPVKLFSLHELDSARAWIAE
jgi:hypothetical protein